MTGRINRQTTTLLEATCSRSDRNRGTMFSTDKARRILPGVSPSGKTM
jgi:hypothetical protein